ncbi:hypothetical protein Droror1_Dr00010694 [Drosera rotundifolia]
MWFELLCGLVLYKFIRIFFAEDDLIDIETSDSDAVFEFASSRRVCCLVRICRKLRFSRCRRITARNGGAATPDVVMRGGDRCGGVGCCGRLGLIEVRWCALSVEGGAAVCFEVVNSEDGDGSIGVVLGGNRWLLRVAR